MATRILPRRGKARVRRPKAHVQPPLLATVEGVLRYLHGDLDRLVSLVIIVAHALTEQNTDLDLDAARILRQYVSDPLSDHVSAI